MLDSVNEKLIAMCQITRKLKNVREKWVKVTLNLFQMSVHNPALGKTAKDRGKRVGEIVNETAIMKEQVRICYLIVSASSKLLVALTARVSAAI